MKQDLQLEKDYLTLQLMRRLDGGRNVRQNGSVKG